MIRAKKISSLLLSVLPPEKLRERIRHRRVRLSREVTLAPFVIPATLARRKRDPGATLLHPFLSLQVTQSRSVALVSQK
jgi:2'-5' RNA ligase